jgi:hypothetical protein
MKTAQQVANEFKTELAALLRKYRAEVNLTENNDNYYTVVDGIEFTIPAVWDDDNNLVSDFATLNIGTWASADNL